MTTENRTESADRTALSRAQGDVVDDLARVLAGHWKNPSEFTHAFCHVMAEAVLASGVVVSARDVKALPARLAAKLCDCFGPVDDPDEHDDECAGVDAGLALRVLLREPATDAAPTGETQGGDDSPSACADWTMLDLLSHWDAEGRPVDYERQEVVADGSWFPIVDLPRIVENFAGSLRREWAAAKRAAVSLPEGGEQRG